MLPKSFPNPDCLKPPKGAATSVLLYVLTKTVPAWSFSVTYRALLRSRVMTPEASPYSVALARRRTPSMSLENNCFEILIYQVVLMHTFILKARLKHSLLTVWELNKKPIRPNEKKTLNDFVIESQVLPKMHWVIRKDQSRSFKNVFFCNIFCTTVSSVRNFRHILMLP